VDLGSEDCGMSDIVRIHTGVPLSGRNFRAWLGSPASGGELELLIEETT